MSLAVLLRNCPHDGSTTGDPLSGSGLNQIYKTRFALKCETFTVQIAKTPIQVPIPQQAPELIDIGFYRPSISISGIVDTVGGDTTTTKAGFENMESLTISRRYWSTATAYTERNNIYYIPYKNALEDAVYRWITTDSAQLEVEVGDANFPKHGKTAEPNPLGSGNSEKSFYVDSEHTGVTVGTGMDDNDNDTVNTLVRETGGAIYVVAVQQARFQVDPATEDRWTFQMQLVCESRKDVVF